MKIFILCGGFGTRLDYEGQLKAKPMVRIGKKPILMHLVESLCVQNFKEFVFCLGHKSETVIDYFLKENKNFINILQKKKNFIEILFKKKKIKFKGTLIYTGMNTGTGGRLLLAYKKLKLDEDIFMTYGDGLSNINLNKLVRFHKKYKKILTLTAVRPPARFGTIKLEGNIVKYFKEKNSLDEGWINGGFFVVEPDFFKYLKNDTTFLEREPFEKLTKNKKLVAYKHNGFWQCMDTLRDKKILEKNIKQKKHLEKN